MKNMETVTRVGHERYRFMTFHRQEILKMRPPSYSAKIPQAICASTEQRGVNVSREI